MRCIFLGRLPDVSHTVFGQEAPTSRCEPCHLPSGGFKGEVCHLAPVFEVTYISWLLFILFKIKALGLSLISYYILLTSSPS